MTEWERIDDIDVVVDQHVATVKICRGPRNHFDRPLLESLGRVYTRLEQESAARVIVLCSEGKHFSAGADLRSDNDGGDPARLYAAAERLFLVDLPVVAAVQGAAVGGGVGLACSADFRVASPDSYFCVNFARLGLHHGFGLSVTLPRLVGPTRAADMLYTARRVDGTEAMAVGLCDRLAPPERLRDEALELAQEIAASATLAVRSIRATLRRGLVEDVRQALAHERTEQMALATTEDCREGIRASMQRRTPVFHGQ